MALQTRISMLFLFLIFVYQLFKKYDENMTITFENNIIMTDCENSEITINGHVFHYKNIQKKATNIGVFWSVVFYTSLSLYLTITNFTLYKYAFAKVHKQIFKWTARYFAFFGITELLCIIPRFDLYTKTVLDTHLVLSGTLLLFLLFLYYPVSKIYMFLKRILTYKKIKQ